jgi:hypothetical protein
MSFERSARAVMAGQKPSPSSAECDGAYGERMSHEAKGMAEIVRTMALLPSSGRARIGPCALAAS